MSLIQQIKKLFLLGTSRGQDVRTYSAIYLHNQTIFIAIVISAFMSCYYLLMGKWNALLSSVPPILFMVIFFYLNAKKKIVLSRIIFIFISNCLITVSVWSIGFKNLSFLHFYNIAILSAIFFMDKKPAWMFGSMFVCFAYVIVCSLFRETYFVGRIAFEEHQETNIRLIHLCFHFGIFMIIFYSLLKVLEKYHRDVFAIESSKIETAKMSALASMSAGIAHEINNPLSIIKLSSQYLRDIIEDTTKEAVSIEQIKKFLDRVETQTDRIGRIVTGMSNFSRTQETDELTWVSLSNLIGDAVVLSKEKIYQNEIKLTSSIYDEGLEVWCKADQLIQVLVNLINNAADAIATKKDKWIRLEAQPQGIGYLKIMVTDSGEGIDPSIQEKIMNPFFTTKAVGKGTGLGLSVSSSIVRRLGSELILDQKCANTRFSFTLKCKSMSKISSKI